MKIWLIASIALASLAAAGVVQASSGGAASSDRTKRQQSIWQQAQGGGTYWCMVPGAQSPSICTTEALCQQRGGAVGAPCKP